MASSKANHPSRHQPCSNPEISFRFPRSYVHLLRLRQRADEGRAKKKSIEPTKSSKEIPVIRKRKITVPIHQFDNPFFNETTVWVDARYTSLSLVDSGRFGVVISAKDSLNNDEKVAIKKVLFSFVSVHSTRHILREIRLLKYLSHPNIVRLMNIDVPASYETWDSVNLVTPLYKCNLRNALVQGRLSCANGEEGNRKKKKRILRQLLSALVHMHSKNILHRDVKSLNVLLDKSYGNAFFCDLGEARFYEHLEDTENLSTNWNHDSNETAELTVGPKTILQSAPELFLREKYNSSVDMWGIGCIAAEMFHPTHQYLFNDISARSPMKMVVHILGYPSEKQMGHLKKKSSKWYLGLVKKFAGDGKYIQRLFKKDEPLLADFISKCLKFSPDERMTAKQALNHPFLENEHVNEETEFHDECDGPQVLGTERGVTSTATINSDKNNTYDFKLSEPPHELSKSKLKQLVWEEVVSFHPEAAKLR